MSETANAPSCTIAGRRVGLDGVRDESANGRVSETATVGVDAVWAVQRDLERTYPAFWTLVGKRGFTGFAKAVWRSTSHRSPRRRRAAEASAVPSAHPQPLPSDGRRIICGESPTIEG